ncbi:unnamed protein product [Nippostrongylus brasiliensis]|uniref:2-(3-amino-3-carboxypropyl)histidine synthase subunit 2 n=1 Tax=Nippostrongylus brasiliensis TaxID=27835 RepID=A0A0N4YWV1_NIPBR|nr:unnamed protein product [Nippostrongylus brasiliensis]
MALKNPPPLRPSSTLDALQLNTERKLRVSFDDEQVEKFFNVSETVQWIKDNRYTRVALQLPDHFLRNAARLARIIESETGAKVFILADTSYRR